MEKVELKQELENLYKKYDMDHVPVEETHPLADFGFMEFADYKRANFIRDYFLELSWATRKSMYQTIMEIS